MLWVGAREDGLVITRGWWFSRVNVEDSSSKAGLKRFIMEKGITSEIQSMCLVMRAKVFSFNLPGIRIFQLILYEYGRDYSTLNYWSLKGKGSACGVQNSIQAKSMSRCVATRRLFYQTGLMWRHLGKWGQLIWPLGISSTYPIHKLLPHFCTRQNYCKHKMWTTFHTHVSLHTFFIRASSSSEFY